MEVLANSASVVHIGDIGKESAAFSTSIKSVNENISGENVVSSRQVVSAGEVVGAGQMIRDRKATNI